MVAITCWFKTTKILWVGKKPDRENHHYLNNWQNHLDLNNAHFFDSTEIWSKLNENWNCVQSIDHNALLTELSQQIEPHKQSSPSTNHIEGIYVIL